MILLGKSLTAIFGGGGGVVGAASSTDNAIARYDGTTGKSLKNSQAIIDDAGNMTITGRVSTNNGRFVLRDDSIENHQTAADASVAVNYFGYNQSTGYYRNFLIFNGKQENIAAFMGADKRVGILTPTPEYPLDVAGAAAIRGDFKVYAQIIDNVGSSGVDGQVLKKVGGLVIWANP